MTAVVVVWVGFERVVMMVGEMWEDELEADFDNDKRDGEGDISFDVDVPD